MAESQNQQPMTPEEIQSFFQPDLNNPQAAINDINDNVTLKNSLEQDKTYDLMLLNLENPEANLADFREAGIDYKNISIQPKEVYRADTKIQEKFLDENGQFNEKKFDKAYDKITSDYNKLYMANESLDKLPTFYTSDDIMQYFAPEKERVNIVDKFQNSYQIVHNTYEQSMGFQQMNELAAPRHSVREISQHQKIFDFDTQKFRDETAEDWGAWGKGFIKGETLVQARWDQDGEHTDLLTGETVSHKAGELKLNEYGKPYTETLSGRSLKNKEIVQAADLITREDSRINKYDPFDADNIENPVWKTVTREVIKTVPYFIPYVNVAWVGADILKTLPSAFGMVAGMVTNNEPPQWLNDTQAWVKKLDSSSVSDKSQEQYWGWENITNMAGAVVRQLKGQNVIFQTFNKVQNAQKAKAAKDYVDKLEPNLKEVQIPRSVTVEGKTTQEMIPAVEFLTNEGKKLTIPGTKDALVSALAKGNAIESSMYNYAKGGEQLSKAYMAIMSAQDTYWDALEAGWDPRSAGLMGITSTMMYRGVLELPLSDWMFPQKDINRAYTRKLIADQLIDNKLIQEGAKDASQQILKSGMLGKAQSWMAKTLQKFGEKYMPTSKAVKDVVGKLNNWSTTTYEAISKDTSGSLFKQGMSHFFSNMGSEALEESYEQLGQDLVYQLFEIGNSVMGHQQNVKSMVSWNQGADVALQTYLTNAVGGALGGSIGGFTGVRNIVQQSKENIPSDQRLIYAIRQGRADALINEIEKISSNVTADGMGGFGSTVLSAIPKKVDAEGKIEYMPVDKVNGIPSQNDLIKDAMISKIRLIDSIINESGYGFSDRDLIQKTLMQDTVIGGLIDDSTSHRVGSKIATDYNFLLSQYVQAKTGLDALKAEQAKNTSKEPVNADAIRLKQLEVDAAKSKLDAWLNDGSRSEYYKEMTMYALTPSIQRMMGPGGALPITLQQYAFSKYGVDSLKDFSDDELEKIRAEYKEVLKDNNNFDATFDASFEAFHQLNQKLSPKLQQIVETPKFKNSLQIAADEKDKVRKLFVQVIEQQKKDENINEAEAERLISSVSSDSYILPVVIDYTRRTKTLSENQKQQLLDTMASAIGTIGTNAAYVPSDVRQAALSLRQIFQGDSMVRIDTKENYEKLRPVIDPKRQVEFDELQLIAEASFDEKHKSQSALEEVLMDNSLSDDEKTELAIFFGEATEEDKDVYAQHGPDRNSLDHNYQTGLLSNAFIELLTPQTLQQRQLLVPALVKGILANPLYTGIANYMLKTGKGFIDTIHDFSGGKLNSELHKSDEIKKDPSRIKELINASLQEVEQYSQDFLQRWNQLVLDRNLTEASNQDPSEIKITEFPDLYGDLHKVLQLKSRTEKPISKSLTTRDAFTDVAVLLGEQGEFNISLDGSSTDVSLLLDMSKKTSERGQSNGIINTLKTTQGHEIQRYEDYVTTMYDEDGKLKFSTDNPFTPLLDDVSIKSRNGNKKVSDIFRRFLDQQGEAETDYSLIFTAEEQMDFDDLAIALQQVAAVITAATSDADVYYYNFNRSLNQWRDAHKVTHNQLALNPTLGEIDLNTGETFLLEIGTMLSTASGFARTSQANISMLLQVDAQNQAAAALRAVNGLMTIADMLPDDDRVDISEIDDPEFRAMLEHPDIITTNLNKFLTEVAGRYRTVLDRVKPALEKSNITTADIVNAYVEAAKMNNPQAYEEIVTHRSAQSFRDSLTAYDILMSMTAISELDADEQAEIFDFAIRSDLRELGILAPLKLAEMAAIDKLIRSGEMEKLSPELRDPMHRGTLLQIDVNSDDTSGEDFYSIYQKYRAKHSKVSGRDVTGQTMQYIQNLLPSVAIDDSIYKTKNVGGKDQPNGLRDDIVHLIEQNANIYAGSYDYIAVRSGASSAELDILGTFAQKLGIPLIVYGDSTLQVDNTRGVNDTPHFVITKSRYNKSSYNPLRMSLYTQVDKAISSLRAVAHEDPTAKVTLNDYIKGLQFRHDAIKGTGVWAENTPTGDEFERTLVNHVGRALQEKGATKENPLIISAFVGPGVSRSQIDGIINSNFPNSDIKIVYTHYATDDELQRTFKNASRSDMSIVINNLTATPSAGMAVKLLQSIYLAAQSRQALVLNTGQQPLEFSNASSLDNDYQYVRNNILNDHIQAMMEALKAFQEKKSEPKPKNPPKKEEDEGDNGGDSGSGNGEIEPVTGGQDPFQFLQQKPQLALGPGTAIQALPPGTSKHTDAANEENTAVMIHTDIYFTGLDNVGQDHGLKREVGNVKEGYHDKLAPIARLFEQIRTGVYNESENNETAENAVSAFKAYVSQAKLADSQDFVQFLKWMEYLTRNASDKFTVEKKIKNIKDLYFFWGQYQQFVNFLQRKLSTHIKDVENSKNNEEFSETSWDVALDPRDEYSRSTCTIKFTTAPEIAITNGSTSHQNEPSVIWFEEFYSQDALGNRKSTGDSSNFKNALGLCYKVTIDNGSQSQQEETVPLVFNIGKFSNYDGYKNSDLRSALKGVFEITDANKGTRGGFVFHTYTTALDNISDLLSKQDDGKKFYLVGSQDTSPRVMYTANAKDHRMSLSELARTTGNNNVYTTGTTFRFTNSEKGGGGYVFTEAVRKKVFGKQWDQPHAQAIVKIVSSEQISDDIGALNEFLSGNEDYGIIWLSSKRFQFDDLILEKSNDSDEKAPTEILAEKMLDGFVQEQKHNPNATDANGVRTSIYEFIENYIRAKNKGNKEFNPGFKVIQDIVLKYIGAYDINGWKNDVAENKSDQMIFYRAFLTSFLRDSLHYDSKQHVNGVFEETITLKAINKYLYDHKDDLKDDTKKIDVAATITRNILAQYETNRKNNRKGGTDAKYAPLAAVDETLTETISYPTIDLERMMTTALYSAGRVLFNEVKHPFTDKDGNHIFEVDPNKTVDLTQVGQEGRKDQNERELESKKALVGELKSVFDVLFYEDREPQRGQVVYYAIDERAGSNVQKDSLNQKAGEAYEGGDPGDNTSIAQATLSDSDWFLQGKLSAINFLFNGFNLRKQLDDETRFKALYGDTTPATPLPTDDSVNKPEKITQDIPTWLYKQLEIYQGDIILNNYDVSGERVSLREKLKDLKKKYEFSYNLEQQPDELWRLTISANGDSRSYLLFPTGGIDTLEKHIYLYTIDSDADGLEHLRFSTGKTILDFPLGNGMEEAFGTNAKKNNILESINSILDEHPNEANGLSQIVFNVEDGKVHFTLGETEYSINPEKSKDDGGVTMKTQDNNDLKGKFDKSLKFLTNQDRIKGITIKGFGEVSKEEALKILTTKKIKGVNTQETLFHEKAINDYLTEINKELENTSGLNNSLTLTHEERIFGVSSFQTITISASGTQELTEILTNLRSLLENAQQAVKDGISLDNSGSTCDKQ